jgi:glycosyltransferase involved in cell wall biosynthesis
MDPEASQQKIAELRSQGLDPQQPICFFAGGLERHHEVSTIIEAAQLLQSRGRRDVQFAICGEGSQAAALHEQARGIPGIHFLGWVDGVTLQAVASISVIGLGAYAKGALMSLGNKPFEYMAGRLAIVSSLPGELATILARNHCGFNSEAGYAESLADRIAELLDNPRRLTAMRDSSYQTWQKNYRSQDVYSRFVNHLTSLRPAAVVAA